MKLVFERSVKGRGGDYLPPNDVENYELPSSLLRESAPRLPELPEIEVSRHYTALAENVYGVNNGFYPLGSCTMKYNPKVNDEMANLEGFTQVHPLQSTDTVQGSLELLVKLEEKLCAITGMDHITFQPSAGAHGEFVGILITKAYHHSRGDEKRNKIIIPDSSHGTNPASAAMGGYKIISVATNENGGVDLDALREAVGEDTAALMLTNPNTLGIFDENIREITEIVHEAGGLCYYDGANLNPIMGIARPADMGFDIVHLNLHKTFSTPHGGGGPGSGPVGVKDFLYEFLPTPMQKKTENGYEFVEPKNSIGKVRANYGNFLVNVRAYTYILSLGADGLLAAAQSATLNANYMRVKLQDTFEIPYNVTCKHEFVLSLEREKKEYGLTAIDIAKGLLDFGVHPPTMYFPLNIPEALMVEPTETESKETLDSTIEALKEIHKKGIEDPEYLHGAPYNTYIRRPDEVGAARNPILKYEW